MHNTATLTGENAKALIMAKSNFNCKPNPKHMLNHNLSPNPNPENQKNIGHCLPLLLLRCERCYTAVLNIFTVAAVADTKWAKGSPE